LSKVSGLKESKKRNQILGTLAKGVKPRALRAEVAV